MSTRSPAPRKGALSAAVAATRMVWCCAGPLITGGAGLAVTGVALHDAWLVTVGGIVALMGPGHVSAAGEP